MEIWSETTLIRPEVFPPPGNNFIFTESKPSSNNKPIYHGLGLEKSISFFKNLNQNRKNMYPITYIIEFRMYIGADRMKN